MLLQLIDLIFTLLTFAIIARAILSWLPIDHYGNPFVQLLDQITAPILEPLRRVVPPIGMMDVTPIVALIILQILQALIHNLIVGLYY
ncbi:MAG: YggT family protein [Anaerolineae bacterium]|nr:YggT family protein [Anaerolineae bacterium]